MKCSQRRSQKTCQVNYLINKYADDNVISVTQDQGVPQEGCPSHAEKVGITMYWRSKGK